MNKINIKTICYAVFIFIFIIYMMFATQIVLSLNKNVATLSIIDFNKINSNSIVYYNIEEQEFLHDAFEQVYFTGWAFCETVESNVNKKIYAILKGKKETYISEYSLDTFPRPDVKAAFPNKILTSNNVMNLNFSTLNLRKGDYELYLYVTENNINYGLVNTGKKFTKDSKGFREYEASRIENFEFIQTNDTLRYSIERTVVDNDSLLVSGWAFLENQKADNQTIYIEIVSSDGQKTTMETTQSQRTDVGGYFNDNRYNFSGFSAKVPVKDLPSHEYSIRIIIDNGGLFASR